MALELHIVGPGLELTRLLRSGEAPLTLTDLTVGTHTVQIDTMEGSVRRRVEIALVAIVRFVDGKVAHEHIYWDQASVLVQIGLLDPRGLPVAGREPELV